MELISLGVVPLRVEILGDLTGQELGSGLFFDAVLVMLQE